MGTKDLLTVDGIINLALGALLLAFPSSVVEALGVPLAENAFYPSILGAVLFGIAIALVIECVWKQGHVVGFGLAGAISINLCGGLALGGWLLLGGLDLPRRGVVFLAVLAVLLVTISSFELCAIRRRSPM